MKTISYRKHQNSSPSAYWASWREALCGGLGQPRAMTPDHKGGPLPSLMARQGFRNHQERAFAAKNLSEVNG